jgi:hypothetical protein
MRVAAPLTTAVITAALLGFGVAFGCSTSNSATSDDAGAGDECAKIDSQCGQPCDPGNEFGVGHYCNHITDCTSLPQAHLCSSLGSQTTHFCTFMCSPADAAAPEGGDGSLPFPTSCGTGAACTCDNSGNCGCTPVSCLGP